MTQREKHLQALNSFVTRIQKDPHVVAILLYGSLAYGTIWERSDIDVELIVRDGTEFAPYRDYVIEEEGIEININAIGELAQFKNDLQKLRGGYDHGKYGGGILVYSKDESLYQLFEEARKIGEDDAPKAYAKKIGGLLDWMYKAEKQVTVLDNPLYAQRFLQLCAAVVAEMELIRHGENPNREAIIRAQELNPRLMEELYVKPSTTVMSKADVIDTLKRLDDYLMQHIDWWSKHIVRFLSDGEVKTVSHIHQHCGRVPVEYLVEKGVLIQATHPVRLFKNSKLTLDEKAYFYIAKEDHKNV
ncbi:MAG: nucleotidyltransferase domain-containing protein [Lachnospiraceae bacterium]|jgi:predicted nucleotidyltransferase|nr:nucleotidyltransferase domain-containing protein [Lachnospiraceae bacterium]